MSAFAFTPEETQHIAELTEKYVTLELEANLARRVADKASSTASYASTRAEKAQHEVFEYIKKVGKSRVLP